MNMEKVPCKSSSMVSICRTLTWQQYSTKTPNKLIKHVHFRLSSGDSVCAKRSAWFPDLNYQSTHEAGMDPSDDLFYQIAVPITYEEQSEPDIATLCPPTFGWVLVWSFHTIFRWRMRQPKCYGRDTWTITSTTTMSMYYQSTRRKTYFHHYQCTYVFLNLRQLSSFMNVGKSYKVNTGNHWLNIKNEIVSSYFTVSS